MSQNLYRPVNVTCWLSFLLAIADWPIRLLANYLAPDKHYLIISKATGLILHSSTLLCHKTCFFKNHNSLYIVLWSLPLFPIPSSTTTLLMICSMHFDPLKVYSFNFANLYMRNPVLYNGYNLFKVAIVYHSIHSIQYSKPSAWIFAQYTIEINELNASKLKQLSITAYTAYHWCRPNTTSSDTLGSKT